MSLILPMLLICIIVLAPLVMYWRRRMMKWRCPRCGLTYIGKSAASSDGTVCAICDKRMSAEFAELRERMRGLITDVRPVGARQVHATRYTPFRNDVTQPRQISDVLPLPVVVYENTQAVVDTEKLPICERKLP